MRVSVFRAAICAVALAVAGRAAAQEKPEFKFEFHGFTGASIYAQDFIANNQGGNAFFVAQQPHVDKTQLGADIRQSRFAFSLAGPKVLGGATPKAIVEMDFYGLTQPAAANLTTGALVSSPGGFTNLQPRARVVVAELNWGNTVLQFGQNTDILVHIAPTSVGHIPQILTFDAGGFGGRHAGLFAWHTLSLDDFKLELRLQVTRSAFNDGVATTGSGLGGAFFSQGEASSIPMVIGRVLLRHKIFEVSVSGAYNQVDLNGVGEDSTIGAANGTKDVYAGAVAGKVYYEGFTLQGNGYIGQNLAQFGCSFGQFSQTKLVDLSEMGAWLQAGYNITPELSAWLLGGIMRMDPNEVFRSSAANGIWGNSVVSGMLRYMEGGYAIGLEYAHFETMYLDRNTPAASKLEAPNGVLKGNQIMLSGFYFF